MLDQIKKGLIANSYAVINDIIITNKMHEYHVSCEHAEVRQLFMHLRGKAALIEIAETSSDYWEKPTQTYSIKFHFGYIPESQLKKLCFNQEKVRTNDCFDYDYCDKIIPGYNKEFEIPEPFKRFGGCMSHFSIGSLHPDTYTELDFKIETIGKSCSYHDCITTIVNIVDQVKPYLTRLFDRRSNMRNCFAPTYQFPDCEETFNKQFQEEAFYFHQLLTPSKKKKQPAFDKFLDFEYIES